MKTYYFTYGSNHMDAKGQTLGKSFTPITAYSPETARTEITRARGDKWAFIYYSPEEAGIDTFHLHFRSLESVTI